MKKFFAIPYIISLIFLVIAFLLDWTYKFNNYEKLLDSIITFSSIILGFIGVLLGILITIKDTKIMKGIYENNYQNSLKNYFYESIFFGFIVVVISTVMYLSIDYQYKIFVFYIWLFVISMFLLSSFRLITTLMEILFKSNLEDYSNDFDSVSKGEDDTFKRKLSKDTKGLKDKKQTYEIE